MEFAKDEIFNIHYNSKEGTIGFGTSNKRGIKRFIKNNKLISLFLSLGIIFSIVNVILIADFFRILSEI